MCNTLNKIINFVILSLYELIASVTVVLLMLFIKFLFDMISFVARIDTKKASFIWLVFVQTSLLATKMIASSKHLSASYRIFPID